MHNGTFSKIICKKNLKAPPIVAGIVLLIIAGISTPPETLSNVKFLLSYSSFIDVYFDTLSKTDLELFDDLKR